MFVNSFMSWGHIHLLSQMIFGWRGLSIYIDWPNTHGMDNPPSATWPKAMFNHQHFELQSDQNGHIPLDKELSL